MPKTRVAFLGPPGTYTHQAALERFGPTIELVEKETITDLFNDLPHVTLAVVPQENSTFGNVIETYDALREAHPMVVKEEITLEIQHCLVARERTEVSNLDCILSHEQALGQCRQYLQRQFPTVPIKATPSTAAAATLVSRSDLAYAGICSRICASTTPGLRILEDGIQDVKDNFTRFYILGSTDYQQPPPRKDEVVAHSALLRLQPTSHTGPMNGRPPSINMLLSSLSLEIARIDRRPARKGGPFQDVYFVEVQRSSADLPSELWSAEVENAVTKLKQIGGDVDVMGVWHS